MKPFNIIRKYPYESLLILISIMGVAADFIYPIVSLMGEIELYITPGEILRGIPMVFLFILLITGRIVINRILLFIFIIFLTISLIYIYIGNESLSSIREARLFFLIKAFLIVMTTALVLKVLELKEFSIDILVRYLVAWIIIFHVIPIIMSHFDILGYQVVSYRVERKGLLFSINAITVVLLATFPFFAIPVSLPGVFMAIAGFTACELTGTKAAAVGGFLIPFLLLVSSFFSKKIRLSRIVPMSVILIGIFFFFADTILSVQEVNYNIYEQVYFQSGNFFHILTTGRSDYYYDLPKYFTENSYLEILLGSPDPMFNELDHLAVLSRFGILGFIVYVILFLKAIKMCACLFINKDWMEIKVAVATLAILAHSTLGGHVIANAIASFPIASVFGMAIYLTKRHNKSKLLPEKFAHICNG